MPDHTVVLASVSASSLVASVPEAPAHVAFGFCEGDLVWAACDIMSGHHLAVPEHTRGVIDGLSPDPERPLSVSFDNGRALDVGEVVLLADDPTPAGTTRRRLEKKALAWMGPPPCADSLSRAHTLSHTRTCTHHRNLTGEGQGGGEGAAGGAGGRVCVRG